MGLYRIMVSAEQEFWETLEIEADNLEQAKSKAIDIACRKHEEEWENKTSTTNIQIEGVEILEEPTPLSSDMAWVEGIMSTGESADE